MRVIPSVGRYVLEEPVGEGAMSEVYRAHDPEINRPLAVKLLRKEFHQNKEIVTRFLSEAKAAGALSHPGIVTVYDVGEAAGFPYIVMELLEGRPLSEVLKEKPRLPLDKVISYGRQLAEALQYAHERGVIHRDIKPSNIWVSADGRSIKLLDFGIARRAEADRLRAEIEALRTQVGQFLGTPRYMSPEQALGQAIDRRTDFFSLGVLLYEMVVGHPAFDGDGLATIAIKITREQPASLLAQAPECPRGLIYIISRLMEKSPNRRYASGAEIAKALLREERALGVGDAGGKHIFSYPAQLLLQGGCVIAIVLTLTFGMIHKRQTAAMQEMIATSGSSVASFIAKNAALSVVENASLSPEKQDWLPLQEFIQHAATDPNVTELRIVDADNTVRASNTAAEIGSKLTDLEESTDNQAAALKSVSFPFQKPIVYGGADFGKVQLVLDGAAFEAAAKRNSRSLLLLGLFIFAIVMAVMTLLSKRLVAPIQVLRQAIEDMCENRFDYRISHNRKDGFGTLFDRFNEMAARLQASAPDAAENAATDIEEAPPIDLDATIISTPDVRKVG